MFKQQFLPCLINENMIGKGKNNMDLLVEKFDYCKKSWHKDFCDDMAMKVKQGHFTDDEKEFIASMIDWKFLFLNCKPSEFYDIMAECDDNHFTDNMSRQEFFEDLKRYGVDVDELEK